ncbi:hypothetical protein GCM10023186_00830 [Hymenobacter koreensis]|uniref:DUF3575 domain-containing protein n=1 Tax=Hymenobacter koreensis TaxID=1084523 RepID=A0ABP8ITD9_9BACT
MAAGILLSQIPRAWAQSAPAVERRPRQLVVKLNAFPLLARGYHLEIEKSFAGYPRHSVGLTGQYYNGRVLDITAANVSRQNEQVHGYGAELLHRVYLSSVADAQLRGLYMGYGPSYQRFSMSFVQDTWVERPDGFGLTYYALVPVPYTEDITRVGASAVLGFQDLLEATPITFDFYIGLGYRYSSFRSELPESRYRAGLLDYGQRGVYLPAGFKIGLLL